MRLPLLLSLALVAAACGGAGDGAAVPSVPGVSEGCADVREAVVTSEPGGTYRFDVTVESADSGWDKYADAWEIRTPDGGVLATRVLVHPHVDEQPFTRSLAGVSIPDGIPRVEVAAHDLVEGFCGATLLVALPPP